MSNPATFEPIGAKADRNRTVILAAAEELFSKQGFSATRVEDVAEAVGLTRAGLFYYYKDKQTLYDAMLADAFRSLVDRLEAVLAADTGTVAQRIECAVEAWVDSIVARPTLARLVLRFVADGASQPAKSILSDNDRIPMLFWALFEQGRESGEIKPLHDDPFHAASAIIGTTICCVAAVANLVPHGKFQPLDPLQVAAHKQEVLFAARHLLGIKNSRRTRR